MIASPTVQRVIAGDLCSGCGLCAGLSNGSFSLQEVAPGFLRPPPDARVPAAAEPAIARACPGSRVAPWRAGPGVDPYWGPVASCQTGFATDPAVRFEGSSGGLLTALALTALDAGLVDGVVHTAADPRAPTRNCTRVSRNRADVIEGAGSRYAPSSPLSAIDTLLRSGERFLFIGKPCDTSALASLAQTDARVLATFPYRLSFFCGGIPSFDGTRRIVAAMGLGGRRLVTFRYRGRGWPGLTEARTLTGESATMRYAESWGRFLSPEVQYRCKICPDAVGGVADIAAADAWYGGEAGYPTFDEQPGRSLVITRTAAGRELLDLAHARGAVTLEALPLAEVGLMQPAQARRKRLVAARTAAARTLLQPVPAMAGTAVGRAARQAGLGETVRNYLGSLRRIATGRR